MLLKIVIKNCYMPMPSNISYWWNFGFLLGMCLLLQLITGIFLSMFYLASVNYSFDSINYIMRDVNIGWLIRYLHANGASLFFIFIYCHIGRGLYNKSFFLKNVWLSGVLILLMLFMAAFIGYVLPWGQMSFWGATVITNLLSSIPYVGSMVTMWLWGGFSIGKATLMRFFSFHFLIPLIMFFLVIIHIIFLHNEGSNNPLGSNSNLDKISFTPFLFLKDFLSLLVVMMFFLFICLLFSEILMDPDNYIPANSLVTPPHIQPEWYFLFAYAILRTIPNKLGGVVMLLMSIMVLAFLAFLAFQMINNFLLKTFFKFIFYLWMLNFIILTFLGAMVIEYPFIEMSLVSSIIYFIFYSIFL